MAYPQSVTYKMPTWLLVAGAAMLVSIPFAFVAVMLDDESSVWDIVEAIAMLILGVCLLVVVKRSWTVFKLGEFLTLEPRGIRPGYGGLIPWTDVDAIEVFRWGPHLQKFIGIRLTSYERYVKSLTDEELSRFRSNAQMARPMGVAMIPSAVTDPASYLTALFALNPLKVLPLEVLTVPQRDVAKMLAHGRLHTEWDFMFAALGFRGRFKTSLAEIQAYRNAALSDAARDGRSTQALSGPDVRPASDASPSAVEAVVDDERRLDRSAGLKSAPVSRGGQWRSDPTDYRAVCWWDGTQWVPSTKYYPAGLPQSVRGGWLPDPTDSRALCWWDGFRWHPTTKHFPPPPGFEAGA